MFTMRLMEEHFPLHNHHHCWVPFSAGSIHRSKSFPQFLVLAPNPRAKPYTALSAVCLYYSTLHLPRECTLSELMVESQYQHNLTRQPLI